jgi:hypothetical protein
MIEMLSWCRCLKRGVIYSGEKGNASLLRKAINCQTVLATSGERGSLYSLFLFLSAVVSLKLRIGESPEPQMAEPAISDQRAFAGRGQLPWKPFYWS